MGSRLATTATSTFWWNRRISAFRSLISCAFEIYAVPSSARQQISTIMTAFAAYRNSGVVSAATSSVSSDTPRGGRAATPLGAATAAVRAARKALALVAGDTEVSYLANSERQLDPGARPRDTSRPSTLRFPRTSGSAVESQSSLPSYACRARSGRQPTYRPRFLEFPIVGLSGTS